MSAARDILVVDDDALIRQSLAAALAAANTQVRVADSAEAALSAVSSSIPDLVLSDVRMPGLGGIELLRLLRERAPSTDVILMTAFDDMSMVISAMRDGARDFLVKPLDLYALRAGVERVFEDRRVRRAAARLADIERQYRLDSIVGHDPKMIDVFKLVGQASASRTSVLVRGESGTGKELIARAIHYNSAVAHEPFVAVNCASLPATLLESELFGHTRGAFTGAMTARKGRFALAGAGTIFLDEIGDTTLDFQSKLLRVLQEREFYPVGAERAERAEARVLAATHRPLEELVTARTFRQDLYFRLRVIEIHLPPLRDRMDDLPRLVEHLIGRAATHAGVKVPVVADDALLAIQRHGWPGNVRELENCLARAVVTATGGVIRAEHLGLAAVANGATPTLRSLDAMEHEHLVDVLRATGGHKGHAADILGVSRPRLYRMLRKHGLE